MSLLSIWAVSVIGSLVVKSDTHLTLNDLAYFALVGWIFFPAFALQRIGTHVRNLVADRTG